MLEIARFVLLEIATIFFLTDILVSPKERILVAIRTFNDWQEVALSRISAEQYHLGDSL